MIDTDNWTTRQDSESARRAIRDREQRNADLVTLWVEAFGTVALVACLFWGLSVAREAGLFNFLSNFLSSNL